MIWMGRLPIILHKDSKEAQVICFGTGQTAAAVYDEEPTGLDVVDVSGALHSIAVILPENKEMLKKKVVTATVMDGRAWLRLIDKRYDVITLESMPPMFAGSNSLHSREYYQLLTEILTGTKSYHVPFSIRLEAIL